MTIDFEKDQQDAMKKTGNIQSLADQVEALEFVIRKVYLIIFLSSNKNTYVTGQSFIIDGGFIVK